MKRSRDFRLQHVGGQALLVPLGARVGAMNALITLNAVGRHIWELLAEDRSPDDIAAAVAARFAVDPERARADVRDFLADLDRKGLLEP